jgi:hypothetical protein
VSTTPEVQVESLPPVLLTPVTNCPPVPMTSAANFRKIENDPIVFSGAWGKMIHEKSDTVPLMLVLQFIVQRWILVLLNLQM